ncbi:MULTISPECIES: toxic anion resistance protein [Moraxella]|uniref:toxic anion resistance protein n=1 Tax=Moraxella sp. CTOTU49803 TaxID=2953840 RepID=UPI0001B391AA|nr:toxic anion resistance protein [Moraxella sp. CTOTU49803]EEV21982.1 toxic anion resistance protein TelA [Enhydrobacter aerosaccus SK60]
MPELTPPETSPVITLEAPQPVAVVPQDEADQLVKLDLTKVPELDAKVNDFVMHVLQTPVNTSVFDEKVKAIHQLGSAEIRASAQIANRMLDRPAKSMDKALFDNSPIAKSLTELRSVVEDLDPSRQGSLSSPRKFLGIIPMGKSVQDYFRKYQSSQNHINAIIESLYHGKDELMKDNASIEQEKVNMWALMQSLRQYIYVGQKIDERLEQKIGELEATDPEKARVVKEELLFYLRQKNMDFLTQLAVNIQGYLALDMIRKNNLELIKGVDRATTTTIAALRTAVMVSQALSSQKLVLDQINALNSTTSSLIESTSVMLKRQTAQLHEQASGSSVDLEKLQKSFNHIYETMHAIDVFKVKALGNMQQTLHVLTQEVDRAQTYLDRTNRQTVSEVANELQIDEEKLGNIKL